MRELLFLRTSSTLFMTCLVAPPMPGCISALLVMIPEHPLTAWEALSAFTAGGQLEVSRQSGVIQV